ncbi:MAG: PDDEXK nuclease domain-containing protein [Proteobacteria bacterium]|nr:PDDEXK nuclease domain-containing protein [Pseudomonadota bacterium]
MPKPTSNFIAKHNSQNLTTAISPLLVEIVGLIQKTQSQVKQSINTAMLQSYWHIGRLIVEHEQNGEQRSSYGKKQLQYLSEQLKEKFGKGFDITNLRNMRRFYLAFPIRETVYLELSWSHYNRLSRIEKTEARSWYHQQSIENNWSVRALDRQINKLYYERLLSSQNKITVEAEAQQKISTQTHLQPLDLLRDPYVLDFLNLNIQGLTESNLEQGLLNNLQEFLLELGKGFAFVGRQQRIRTEDQDFYIDLVFYNFKLKCFLLIDLKLGKLSHQDVGQMDTYVRIYDQHHRNKDDNPTIGLILCSQKSEAVVKYSVLTDKQQLFSAKYMPYLPTVQELKDELEKERINVETAIEKKIEETQALYQLNPLVK